MNIDFLVTGGLLSLLWMALAVQDVRVQKLDNAATIGTFTLALGYRLGTGTSGSYLLALGACIAAALIIYATGLIGGGDAKLLLSVLAWRPTMETWMVALACLATIGGAALTWSRLVRRKVASHRYPLGGAISAAGLIVVWAL